MHLLNLLKIMSALCIGIQPVICCETNETGIYDKHVKKCEMDMTINGLTIPKDFLRLCRLAMYINPMDTYAAVADTCNLYTNIRVKPLQDIEQMNFFDKRNIVITRTNDGNNIIIVTGITVIALDKKRLAERVLNAKIFDILDIAVLNYQTDTSKTNADELREALFLKEAALPDEASKTLKRKRVQEALNKIKQLMIDIAEYNKMKGTKTGEQAKNWIEQNFIIDESKKASNAEIIEKITTSNSNALGGFIAGTQQSAETRYISDLLHSEQLYKVWSDNESKAVHFFFTQRDLCPNCNKLIADWDRIPVKIILSARIGNRDLVSTVDKIMKLGTDCWIEYEPKHPASLPKNTNITRVRIPDLTAKSIDDFPIETAVKSPLWQRPSTDSKESKDIVEIKKLLSAIPKNIDESCSAIGGNYYANKQLEECSLSPDCENFIQNATQYNNSQFNVLSLLLKFYDTFRLPDETQKLEFTLVKIFNAIRN